MTELIDTVPRTEADLPWDQQIPVTTCFGFCSKTHNIKLMVGYSIYANGMYRLYAYEQIGGQALQLWRTFLVSPEAAVESAETLCDECEDYLDTFSLMRRPDEDLNFDDYIQHIELQVTKMFT